MNSKRLSIVGLVIILAVLSRIAYAQTLDQFTYMPAISVPPSPTPTPPPTATLTPTPTTPPRSERVYSDNLQLTIGPEDALMVTGMLYNDTSAAIANPIVAMDVLDRQNKVAGSASSDPTQSFTMVPSGGKTPFFISGPGLASKFQNLYLTPTWQSETRIVTSLAIVRSETYDDAAGLHHLKGYVRNNSTSTVTNPQAFCAVYIAGLGIESSKPIPLGVMTMAPQAEVFFDVAFGYTNVGEHSFEALAYGYTP